jgi:hypothetical protein
MLTTMSGREGRVCLAGVAAAGVILVCAPIANADDPSACEQQGAPSSASQPCEQQQQQQPGMPKLPDNRNSNTNDANSQPPQQDPQQSPQQAPQQKPQQGDLADKNCWVVNGVPRWNAPGTAPLPTGPGDVVSWCPTTYGLQPH